MAPSRQQEAISKPNQFVVPACKNCRSCLPAHMPLKCEVYSGRQACPQAIKIRNAFWQAVLPQHSPQAGVFLAGTVCPKTFMLVPKLRFGYALVKEALLRLLHAISSIPDLQFPVFLLHEEHMKRQNCVSNAETLRKVPSLKYLRQE